MEFTWIPINKPPLNTAKNIYCRECKKKHLMYPVYDEDTNNITEWWCFNKNEPYKEISLI